MGLTGEPRLALVPDRHRSRPYSSSSPGSARRPTLRLLAGGAVVVVFLLLGWLVYRAAHGNGESATSGQAGPPAAALPAPRHSDGLVWQDEFTGPAGSAPDPAHWQTLSGAREDQLQYFTTGRGTVALDGAGHLVITARRQSYTDSAGVTRQFTSGSIETRGLFQTRYGTLLARIKIPSGKGLWPAFWALGSSYSKVGWPQSGEIDVMENTGDNPFRIKGSIHGPQTGSSADYAIHFDKSSPASLAGGFHIYGVTWRPGKIIFMLDGVHYGTVTPADLSSGQRWVFDRPFFLILTLAIKAGPARPNAATRFPARMLVDWVRVYR